jgi:hypothetical protein
MHVHVHVVYGRLARLAYSDLNVRRSGVCSLSTDGAVRCGDMDMI